MPSAQKQSLENAQHPVALSSPGPGSNEPSSTKMQRMSAGWQLTHLPRTGGSSSNLKAVFGMVWPQIQALWVGEILPGEMDTSKREVAALRASALPRPVHWAVDPASCLQPTAAPTFGKLPLANRSSSQQPRPVTAVSMGTHEGWAGAEVQAKAGLQLRPCPHLASSPPSCLVPSLFFY